MHCEIQLTRGQVAKVSPEWYAFLSQWKWYAQWSRFTRSYYAIRRARRGEWIKEGDRILMHRVVLGLSLADPRQGDHINHDTLDNRPENLRIGTCAQNQMNARRRRDNKSGFKGVMFRSDHGYWRYQITANGKRITKNGFATAEEAAKARRMKMNELHGKFAKES